MTRCELEAWASAGLLAAVFVLAGFALVAEPVLAVYAVLLAVFVGIFRSITRSNTDSE